MMKQLSIMTNFYTREWNNLTLNILWTAGAKQDSFGKIVWNELKLSVKKAPENGEATQYMKKFIAENFWVSPKNVEILFGETSPHKAFLIKNPIKIPEPLKELISLH